MHEPDLWLSWQILSLLEISLFQLKSVYTHLPHTSTGDIYVEILTVVRRVPMPTKNTAVWTNTLRFDISSEIFYLYIGSSQSVVKAFRLRSVVSLTIQQTRFIRIGWSLGVPYSSLSLLLRFDSLHSDFCTQYYTFVHGFTIPNMNLIRQINWFHFTTIQISARCALPDLLSPTWSNIQFRLFCRAPDAISVSRLAATTESSTGREGSTLRKQRCVCL